MDYYQGASQEPQRAADPRELVVLTTGADQSDLGWPGCTMRVVIPASFITATGSGVAVKFGAGKSRGLHIAEAFIGHARVLPFNFENAPTVLKFKGSLEAQINKNSSTTTHLLRNFVVKQGKNLIVAFFMDDESNDEPVAKLPTAGWRSFYKCGGERDTDALRAVGYDERTSKFVSHGVLELGIGGNI